MAKDFAIIETGGKQYRVSVGDRITTETLEVKAGDSFTFDNVLMRSVGDQVKIGVPYIAQAQVHAKMTGNSRGEKKIIFKYHSKTRQRRKKGHRQDQSEIEIVSI
jgi:large subunit ribosomal protein L21